MSKFLCRMFILILCSYLTPLTYGTESNSTELAITSLTDEEAAALELKCLNNEPEYCDKVIKHYNSQKNNNKLFVLDLKLCLKKPGKNDDSCLTDERRACVSKKDNCFSAAVGYAIASNFKRSLEFLKRHLDYNSRSKIKTNWDHIQYEAQFEALSELPEFKTLVANGKRRELLLEAINLKLMTKTNGGLSKVSDKCAQEHHKLACDLIYTECVDKHKAHACFIHAMNLEEKDGVTNGTIELYKLACRYGKESACALYAERLKEKNDERQAEFDANDRALAEMRANEAKARMEEAKWTAVTNSITNYTNYTNYTNQMDQNLQNRLAREKASFDNDQIRQNQRKLEIEQQRLKNDIRALQLDYGY